MSAPKGYAGRPWLQRRVRLGNRVGRRLIRWGKRLQANANAAANRATAEYVAYRDYPASDVGDTE